MKSGGRGCLGINLCCKAGKTVRHLVRPCHELNTRLVHNHDSCDTDWTGREPTIFWKMKRIAYPDGCMVRRRPQTTKKKRQMDGEVGTGKRCMGSYLQERQSFLSGNIILLTGALSWVQSMIPIVSSVTFHFEATRDECFAILVRSCEFGVLILFYGLVRRLSLSTIHSQPFTASKGIPYHVL
jgi:hypothetical protein